MGLLDAVTDRESGSLHQTLEPRSNYFVGRMQQELGAGKGNVGIMLTGVNRVLGDGWVLGAGLRSTRYDRDRANAVSATLERYFDSAGAGEWRAAATLVTTRLVGVATSSALRLQLDRYFGDRARLGLLVAGGREIDNLGQGALLISNVSSVSLSGRWPIAPAWSLLGEVGQHRLGSRYTRSAGRLGVQLDF